MASLKDVLKHKILGGKVKYRSDMIDDQEVSSDIEPTDVELAAEEVPEAPADEVSEESVEESEAV